MSLLAPWLLFPLVLGVVTVGCGLLLERAAGMRLSGALLAPSGLAVAIVVAGFATFDAATAQLAIPAVVALAVTGLGCGVSRGRPRLDGWAVTAGLVVFSVFAAPVVLSGDATFAGYIKLDDTATFLSLTDRVMEHGRSLVGLAPSSYEATLSVNLAHGYPVGSLLPLGIGRALVGEDGAWVYQPYLAFLAVMLALVLYDLAGQAVRPKALRAVVAAVAAQPALLYGFALWGGIKELAAAPLVALAAALVPRVAGSSSPRRLLPLAVAAAAVLGVLSLGGTVWVLISVAAALVLGTRGRRHAARVGTFAGAVLLLSLPTLSDSRSFISQSTEIEVRSATVLGNLVHPLSTLQIFGVWPNGDFRFAPSDLTATRVLIATVALVGLAGAIFAWRERAWGVLLYVGSAIAGCALIAVLASPWVVGKAYAIASPALLFLAVLGCVGLIGRGRRTEGLIALAAVAGGVLWSNVLAYRDVNLAPRGQLRELELIGHRFAGEGPAMMTEYQPYGVRHFLRALDAEGASELRRRPIPLRSGAQLEKGVYADLDDFQESAIMVYRTLVLRRSPLASRPPGVYRLVWSGRAYEVWQRPAVVGAPVAHLPLGDGVDPEAQPRCDAVRALARSGRSLIAAGRADTAVVVGLGSLTRPPGWSVGPGGLAVFPTGVGTMRGSIRLRTAGRYSVWIGGSFRRRIEALVDGRLVGAQTHKLNNAGQYTLLGALTLGAGDHVMELRYATDLLEPGSGGAEYGLGPLVVRRAGDRAPVSRLSASDAGDLCGRTLDWIEAATP